MIQLPDSAVLQKLYGDTANQIHKKRYETLIVFFENHFSKKDPLQFFSAPGRIEIGGNHTDHNNGKVLAGAVDLDSVAAVSKNSDYKITLYSEGFDKPFRVDLNQLNKKKKEEGTTTALIRGIAYKLKESGYTLGGFDGVMTSSVMVGSGLSSSASVEVLIGTIFNTLFNKNKISDKEIASIGQWAENNYFNKPCGLMDQTTCSIGGIITIDFKNSRNPSIEKIDFDFDSTGYSVLIVNTGGSHSDLTDDYASVRLEMNKTAHQLGGKVMRDISLETLLDNIPRIRKKLGDRPLLRSLHYLQENNRVTAEVNALKNNNFSRFLELVFESGNSSFKYLQNCYTPKNLNNQSIPLALALTELFIKKSGSGACRVHGGGFAGTIQVFLPNNQVDSYKQFISPVFGKNTILDLQIRSIGSCTLN
ncbi:MAG: galactokinase family protein [bacterium]